MESKKWHGNGASSGIAAGKVWVLRARPINFQPPTGEQGGTVDREAEAVALQKAIESTDHVLAGLEEKTFREKGEEFAAIFSAHRLLLSDPAFGKEALRRIQENGSTASNAIQEVTDESVALLQGLDDPYLRQRADDLREVAQQILRQLAGLDATFNSDFPQEGKWVVVADELTTAETISLPKERILGFIVRRGGTTSHAAILARTYGIPAVIGIDGTWEDLSALQAAGLDGDTGWIEALSAEELQGVSEKTENNGDEADTLPSDSGMLKEMILAANIGSPDDLRLLKRFGARGVGLYRTEFLFMGNTLPTEEEQVEAYGKVIAECAPHLTVIRTLDIGGDKQAPALNLPQEKNPFLGVRALRFCLKNPDLFTKQLRAVWRASVNGPTAVMFPMIATLEELLTAKQLLNQAKDGLLERGYTVGELQVGMMIEIPAAAWIAPRLAREVDFFSIGTNDLTQYTMAVDRENDKLSELYQTYHPAVLAMVARVAKAAASAGIWVGICGESAGDPLLTNFFVALGIKELSMSPGLLPKIRQKLARLNLTDPEKETLVRAVLECETSSEVQVFLENR